jgi:hypothetical protein
MSASEMALCPFTTLSTFKAELSHKRSNLLLITKPLYAHWFVHVGGRFEYFIINSFLLFTFVMNIVTTTPKALNFVFVAGSCLED